VRLDVVLCHEKVMGPEAQGLQGGGEKFAGVLQMVPDEFTGKKKTPSLLSGQGERERGRVGVSFQNLVGSVFLVKRRRFTAPKCTSMIGSKSLRRSGGRRGLLPLERGRAQPRTWERDV